MDAALLQVEFVVEAGWGEVNINLDFIVMKVFTCGFNFRVINIIAEFNSPITMSFFKSHLSPPSPTRLFCVTFSYLSPPSPIHIWSPIRASGS
jgi:hypothetical protein